MYYPHNVYRYGTAIEYEACMKKIFAKKNAPRGRLKDENSRYDPPEYACFIDHISRSAKHK
jgi:hypothetical protein